MARTKTKRQFRYLLSKGSPLSPAQKKRLIAERRSGKLRLTSKPRRRRR